MQRYKIEGGYYLNGDVYIDGSKNASLPIICASIILNTRVRLYNVPKIKDVDSLLALLREYKVYIKEKDNYIEINSKTLKYEDVVCDVAKNFRASYYLLGCLINHSNKLKVCKQGGCNLGYRPINLHKYAFDRLGYNLKEDGEFYYLEKIKDSKHTIKFKSISLGATINAILGSIATKRKIKIINPSLEPEVLDLIKFLNIAGINIKVNKKSIVVDSKRSIKPFVEYKVMYDRIEAGSYALIAALVGNDVKIHNFDSEYLTSLLSVFDTMGVNYQVSDNVLRVFKSKKINPIKLETNPYPSFPTDLFQMLSILCIASDGLSIVKDNIYPLRYTQLQEISKYGVEFENKDNELHIYGNSAFKNGEFKGRELRGTMSLIMYALASNGKSYVYGKKFIDRGYSNVIGKLLSIGACIEVEEIEE